MDVPLGYVPKTKTYNVIPLWTWLFIQVCIFLHCCPSCLQASQVPALLVEGSCVSGPRSSCASKAAIPGPARGGVTWLHSDPHRRWLIWVVGKQSQQISGFQWLHLVRLCCTAELALPEDKLYCNISKGNINHVLREDCSPFCQPAVFVYPLYNRWLVIKTNQKENVNKILVYLGSV